MPTMDGVTASTIIRASEKNNSDFSDFNLPPSLPTKLIQQCKGKHIPIVAMTASIMGDDKGKCLSAGMDDVLTKPFEHAQVKKILADIAQSVSE